MKIGVVGTIWVNTPPHGYGGTEFVVYNLVNGLTKKGHDVTLFGPKTTQVSAKVVGTVEKPLREDNVEWTNVAYTIYHITEAFDRAADFDVLHIHLNKSQDYIALPLAQQSKTPVVFTLHFKVPTTTFHYDRYLVLTKYGRLPFTSISDSQRIGLPVNFIATVYNSLPIEEFPFQDKPQEYFVWGGGSPHPAVAPNTFSARWTGELLPAKSETYRFTINSDDGVRLWVNNRLIIDKWFNHSAREYSGSIALTAGVKVPIKLEYYENKGQALVQMYWSSPTTPRAVVPQSALIPD